MFRFFFLLLILCHAIVNINWKVKQCSYSNGKPYKQCDDLKGCECLHNETINETCTECGDTCALIETKEKCNANMHCEFNSQCQRIDLWKQTIRFYNIEVSQDDWDFINSPEQIFKEPEPYISCNFTMNYLQENPKTFEYAMIKVKGSLGGKVSCYNGTNVVKCRSLSYQINIDKDLPKNFDGERPVVGGKDKLQFHSMKNDESLMIERLSYSIMHHYLNISTARAVHCVLFLNGEKLGVFLNTEEIDEKSIGPILFGEKGTMYKDVWPFDYGPLSYANGVWSYVEIELMDELRNASLQCVSENQLEMKCTADEGRLMLKKYIDTDSYVKAMLANHLLNNFDGTPKNLHNHYWFQNKNNGPLVFVPWDYNNLIMSKLCKVDKGTGLIKGFGNISWYQFEDVENAVAGVCDAPPFQYLPSTSDEKSLLCSCVPRFNGLGFYSVQHMTCHGAFSIVVSQSLIDDYFNYRDAAFKGNEIDIKNGVKSMVEYWSQQIRHHINTSTIKYPMKDVWEVGIKRILLVFDYGLDQLMNRKKKVQPENIKAHFEWLENRAKKLGKCDDLCRSSSECQTQCLGNSFCYNSKCYSQITMTECDRCSSNLECQDLGCENSECSLNVESTYKICWSGNTTAEECQGNSEPLKWLDEGIAVCLSETKYERCMRRKNEKSGVSTAESKSIFSKSEISTAESNVFSKTYGIVLILILLFIL